MNLISLIYIMSILLAPCTIDALGTTAINRILSRARNSNTPTATIEKDLEFLKSHRHMKAAQELEAVLYEREMSSLRSPMIEPSESITPTPSIKTISPEQELRNQKLALLEQKTNTLIQNSINHRLAMRAEAVAYPTILSPRWARMATQDKSYQAEFKKLNQELIALNTSWPNQSLEQFERIQEVKKSLALDNAQIDILADNAFRREKGPEIAALFDSAQAWNDAFLIAQNELLDYNAKIDELEPILSVFHAEQQFNLLKQMIVEQAYSYLPPKPSAMINAEKKLLEELLENQQIA